jgi:cytochrome c peroxidase
MRRLAALALLAIPIAIPLTGCAPADVGPPPWETANPILPLPTPPLGIETTFEELDAPPTPESVRLGRWLFFDPRLSADGTISCATCHRPENAFSEPTPVSTGIGGQKGARKAPPVINLAWTIFPNFFWDGRAASLEEQAAGPLINPIEMGFETHDDVVATVGAIEGYGPYFEEVFGDPEVTIDRITRAIADYERTRMSGNSPWDRWRAGDESAVSDQVKLGHDVFFDKAFCNQCHLGQNFTDDQFHNLGVGWNAESGEFADIGRYEISGVEADMGAFKTPGLRDVTKHAPYMHDGSQATLREVVEHYDKGGNANPQLSPKITSLGLTDEEIDALVAFMEALDGEGFLDTAPEAFP